MSLKPLRKTKTPASKAANIRALGVMAVCGIMLAMVVAARQFSNPEQVSAAPAPEATAMESPVMSSAQPEATQTDVKRTEAARKPEPRKKTVAPQVRASTSVTVTAPQPAAMSSAVQAPSAKTQVTMVPEPERELATISGCLERDDDDFRLKDATGSDVPKARSWKSGFVKKSAPTIELVDTNTVRLVNNAGHRVTVSGVLKDREMQVRSIQRLPGTCN